MTRRFDHEDGPVLPAPVQTGLPVLDFPRIPGPVLDVLRRVPVREPGDVAGRVLWLSRLGVSVLPHRAVTGGWLCTLIATTGSAGELPAGVFLVSDLEIRTAFATTAPAIATAMLSPAEFADAWRVRCAGHGHSPMLVNALLSALDAEASTLALDGRVLSGSGCRTLVGLRTAVQRMQHCGLLLALDSGCGAEAEAARFGLRLPAPAWPSA